MSTIQNGVRHDGFVDSYLRGFCGFSVALDTFGYFTNGLICLDQSMAYSFLESGGRRNEPASIAQALDHFQLFQTDRNGRRLMLLIYKSDFVSFYTCLFYLQDRQEPHCLRIRSLSVQAQKPFKFRGSSFSVIYLSCSLFLHCAKEYQEQFGSHITR